MNIMEKLGVSRVKRDQFWDYSPDGTYLVSSRGDTEGEPLGRDAVAALVEAGTVDASYLDTVPESEGFNLGGLQIGTKAIVITGAVVLGLAALLGTVVVFLRKKGNDVDNGY